MRTSQTQTPPTGRGTHVSSTQNVSQTFAACARSAPITATRLRIGLPTQLDQAAKNGRPPRQHHAEQRARRSHSSQTPVATNCAQGAEGGRESAGAVGLMARRATYGGGFGMMDEEFRTFQGWQRTIHWCPLLHVAVSTTLDEPRNWWPVSGRVEVPPSVPSSLWK